jgi:hypothetical protein
MRHDRLGLCWSNLESMDHAYRDGSDETVDSIGCRDELEAVIEKSRKSYIADSLQKAIKEACALRCDFGHGWYHDSRVAPGTHTAPMFWMRGFALYQSASCGLVKKCDECKVPKYDVICDFSHRIRDRYSKPLDWNNRDDWWKPDDWSLGFAEFYVNGEWVDRAEKQGLCY